MTELFNLKNKVAVVTGGSRGIGKGIAVGLAEAGADIAIIQRSDNEETKKEIEALGVKCEIFRCDLSNLKDVRVILPKINEKMGSIDILVNNAVFRN